MPRILILYGSQTGTAQDLAEQIWRESKRWSCSGPVLALDDWPVEQLLQERLVVFVVATTGNGDEPDNMRQTWKFLLRRHLPPDLCAHMQYAVLGLGDSSYAKFNYAAKKLHKRLQQLGGRPVVPPGLCDDQHDHGLAAVALPWMTALWAELEQQCALQRPPNDTAVNVLLKWHTEVLNAAAAAATDTELFSWPLAGDSRLTLTLEQNKRTTASDHFQDVRLLRFHYPADVSWQAGDVLQVRPCNSDEQVARFFVLAAEHRWPLTPDTVVRVRSAYADMPLPLAYAQPVTARQLAKYVWDLSARPRQRAFELLAQHCLDELEREKLEEFGTAEGLDELIAYVHRPRRSILEVLEDFRQASGGLTLPLLVELFGIIQPRSYSIASMPSSGTLDLLVAVVEYRTRMAAPRLGLCSNWLKSELRAGDTIPAAIKRGTLQLPPNPRTPLVLVGPGTGIAPFRSVVQSRRNDGAATTLLVFFGCRNRAKDCHFADDFAAWQQQAAPPACCVVEVFVAYSRDQPHKVYVQQLIVEQRDRLRALICDEGAFVLVAGSSTDMPKAVRQAFADVLAGSADSVEHMVKSKRYQEETWS